MLNYSLRNVSISLTIILLGLLMACTPQETQELNVTSDNMLVQTRITNATLESPALATSTPTESVTVMPLPRISNTSTPVSILSRPKLVR